MRPGRLIAMPIVLCVLLSGCGGGHSGPAPGTTAAAKVDVRVLRPRDGTRTRSSAIVVSGIAHGAFEVTVDGRQATLRPVAGGRLFAVRVRLRLGRNDLAIVARSGGTVARAKVQVTRTRARRHAPAPGSSTGPAVTPQPGPAAPPPGGPSNPQGGTPAPSAAAQPPESGGSGAPQGGPSAPAPKPAPPQGGPPAQVGP
jgi:hypothetical protein